MNSFYLLLHFAKNISPNNCGIRDLREKDKEIEGGRAAERGAFIFI